ncbi:hypothetical protein BCR33DRAFT_739029 [Rhizoclosmatium globosum]|uniref:Uncharacterized protein n=1 Tax=Rhizoclosmatium globosum TaxID=329046 RepID=A0A1Y2C7N7_9FUNG|nr:hypothetical protein BCR33DRAFT_739029 [Rhizoclosmatium globosum]|eukprot:ORY42917.1 hypothetical protein BCR33DRAFT_739029 [Rhizoclosmatium globosum]
MPHEQGFRKFQLKVKKSIESIKVALRFKSSAIPTPLQTVPSSPIIVPSAILLDNASLTHDSDMDAIVPMGSVTVMATTDAFDTDAASTQSSLEVPDLQLHTHVDGSGLAGLAQIAPVLEAANLADIPVVVAADTIEETPTVTVTAPVLLPADVSPAKQSMNNDEFDGDFVAASSFLPAKFPGDDLDPELFTVTGSIKKNQPYLTNSSSDYFDGIVGHSPNQPHQRDGFACPKFNMEDCTDCSEAAQIEMLLELSMVYLEGYEDKNAITCITAALDGCTHFEKPTNSAPLTLPAQNENNENPPLLPNVEQPRVLMFDDEGLSRVKISLE